MGYTLIWVLSTSDTYHITNEWAQRTSEWCDKCHELIKSISKCNPCNNLFITYHIQGIVRMYQWVRNAILACLMITYDTVNGLFCAMHVTPRILFTLRLRCFLNILSKRISRKRIIVYRKYVMFIKQSPTRFTMVTKNDTKTRHFLIYICRHIIQNCFLISYYNNIAVIIIIITIQLLGTNSFSSWSRHGPLRNMHYYLMMIEHAHRDAVAKHRINDITHVWYRWYDVLPLWKCDVVSYGLYQWRYSPYRAPSM